MIYFIYFLVAVIVIISIIAIINLRIKKFVKKNSSLLKELGDINKKFSFNNFNKVMKLHNTCSYKRQFDNFNYYKYCFEYIKNNQVYFSKLLLELAENIKKYNEYLDQCKELKTSFTKKNTRKSFLPFSLIIKKELKLFTRNKLYPPISIDILCSASYTSPQGRNHYSNSKTFNSKEINEMLIDAKKLIEKEIEKTKELASLPKLTSKERYQILNKNNNSCSVCGARASDGVKIIIDYIDSSNTSKVDNLHTICNLCRSGKKTLNQK